MRVIAQVLLHKVQKLIFVGMIGCLIFGLSDIWQRWRHATPTEVAYSERAAKDLPKHVTLKNIALSPISAVAIREYGEASVYIPIRGRDAAQPNVVQVLLKTSRAELLALFPNSKEKKEDVTALKDTLLVAAKISSETAVTGMVVSDFNVSNRTKAALKKAIPGLASDFSVLSEGETPSLGRGVLLLIFSAVLFVLFVLSATGGKELRSESPFSTANVPPPLPHSEPPPLKPNG